MRSNFRLTGTGVDARRRTADDNALCAGEGGGGRRRGGGGGGGRRHVVPEELPHAIPGFLDARAEGGGGTALDVSGRKKDGLNKNF
jgi:hypothetical protein